MKEYMTSSGILVSQEGRNQDSYLHLHNLKTKRWNEARIDGCFGEKKQRVKEHADWEMSGVASMYIYSREYWWNKKDKSA